MMEQEQLEKRLQDLEEMLASARAEIDALKALLGDKASRADVDGVAAILAITRTDAARMERILDAAHSRIDVTPELVRSLQDHRASESYRRVYEQVSPLVSVCIATYNRSRLLTERCLPSVLAQDYPNLEVIVVGDGCTDDTPQAVARIADPRIRFENLSHRGDYPEDTVERWMVAGAPAANRALELARGDLITYLDDDDEFVPGRIRKLVDFLQQTRAEGVWHPFYYEPAPDRWETNPAVEFRHAQVTTGAILYLSWFKVLGWDAQGYRNHEPGDWAHFRKIKYLGAKLQRFPEPLLRHYCERRQNA